MFSPERGPSSSDHAPLDSRLPTSFQKAEKNPHSRISDAVNAPLKLCTDRTEQALGTIAFYVHWAH